MKQKRDARGRFLPKEKVYATGIKGFLPGLVCEPAPGHRKQYAENTVFEEEGGSICGPGVMHAVDSTLDVLDYVPLVNSDGTLSEFAEVEALAPVKREDNKWATRKLKVGKKLSFNEFVKVCVENIASAIKGCAISKIKPRDGIKTKIHKGVLKIRNFGDYAHASNHINYAQIGSMDNWVQICNSGDNVKISSTGCKAKIASAGDKVKIANSGYIAYIGSSGEDVQIACSGDSARIASSGYGARINCSGAFTKVSSAGDNVIIISSGAKSIVTAVGFGSNVSASLGSWITLAEYDECGTCTCVKSACVDGVNIKPGVKYALICGEFKEVK